MRSFVRAFLSFFFSPIGLFGMAAIDSSLVFFMPLGMDAVLIIMSARQPGLFWVYGLLATGGSMVGSAITYWVGSKVGKHGLTRFVSASRLKRVTDRVSGAAAASIAALALVPPPFPFTLFVLTGGAFGLNPRIFFLTLACTKIVRFGITGALAARYGTRIVAWTETTTFEVIVGVLIVIAVGGAIASAVIVVRRARG